MYNRCCPGAMLAQDRQGHHAFFSYVLVVTSTHGARSTAHHSSAHACPLSHSGHAQPYPTHFIYPYTYPPRNIPRISSHTPTSFGHSAGSTWYSFNVLPLVYTMVKSNSRMLIMSSARRPDGQWQAVGNKPANKKPNGYSLKCCTWPRLRVMQMEMPGPETRQSPEVRSNPRVGNSGYP